ncbi:MAG: hypothetical protein NT151_13090 [Acidobacteria bacterium]|nr:hypothetical protein [Acidobacteriota bacterium]
MITFRCITTIHGVMRAVTVVPLLVLCWSVHGMAAVQTPAADAAWSHVRVPGGTAVLLRVAGLDPATPRAQALWSLVRSLYAFAEKFEPVADQRRSRVYAYLQAIADFERARSGLPAGPVALAIAKVPESRRRLDALCAAIGSQLRPEGSRFTMHAAPGEREQQRRAWLKEAGLDVDAIEIEMNAGRSVSLTLPGDNVPSPLTEGTWDALLQPPPERAGVLLAAILMDRRASLLFVGLSATDATTRAYIAARPDLLDAIYRTSRVAALAAHGQSLRVRDGRVDVPGGAGAVPLWESLVGEAIIRPDRFLLELLGRNDGQVAILYDAIAYLDEAGQTFVLGLGQRNVEPRVVRFRALYAASLTANAGGNPVDHPFSHNVYDAAHILAMMRFSPDGRPQAPAWRKLWDRALASDEIPAAPDDEVKGIEQDGFLYAADIVERICVANTTSRRERAEMWLFAQRVFAHASIGAMPDVLVALRGYQRFGALVLTLERLGITDPSVYARTLIRAERVMSIGGTTTAANALALFQGSLAMVERARLGHAIDAETAGRLVVSLASVPMTSDGEAFGSVAGWIELVFLSALKPPLVPLEVPTDAATLERHVLRAFAGLARNSEPRSAPVVEIEGLRYRVDPAAADVARWQAMRAAQGGVTLDQVLAFARAVEALAADVSAVSALPARLSALVASAKPLLAHESRAQTAAGVPPRLGRLLDEATTRVARIRKPENLKELPDIARPLLRAVDYFLAEVLIALAYAPHLGDPAGKAMLAGDPSPRHDWGLTERIEKDRLRAPWRIPTWTRDAAGVWRVSGSLMALDVGLGDLALRRVFTESLPDPPTLSANDRAAFTEGVSLANAFDYLDEDRDQLVDALRRGRARVASAQSNPGTLTDLMNAAGIRGARREMIPWTLANEPERLPDFFSLSDVLRVGQVRPSSIERLDAWGTSGLAREGCLCLTFPLTGDWETMAGRRGKAVVASLMPDMALLVADALRERHLPAMLTRSMLAAATQDFEDDVRLAFEDDWISMFRQVRKTLPPRMDDYIASLTTNGPLVPIR